MVEIGLNYVINYEILKIHLFDFWITEYNLFFVF